MSDYKDATLPVERRVALLLREMTLEEKVGQLGQHIPGWTAYKKDGGAITITDSIKKAISNHEIGLISEALLAYHTADMRYAAEPGTFRILVGPDSLRTKEVDFEFRGC